MDENSSKQSVFPDETVQNPAQSGRKLDILDGSDPFNSNVSKSNRSLLMILCVFAVLKSGQTHRAGYGTFTLFARNIGKKRSLFVIKNTSFRHFCTCFRHF